MVDSSIPSDFELIVVPNPEAPRDLQILGERYWEHAGLHPTYGTVCWSHKTSEIDHTPWANSLYHAAAAGVCVSMPAHSCMQCQGVLTLSSRTSLDAARRGEEVKCRDCSPTLNKYVAKVLDPEEQAKQEKIAEQKREQELRREETRAVERAQREAAEKLETLQREVLESRYASETEDDGGYTFAHASIKAKLGALTALHTASQPDGLIYSVNFSDRSMAPNDRLSHELFVEAWHADLLLIHPSSSPTSFVWDEQDPTKLGDGVYLERARFMVPGEGALAPRRELFTQELREQLRLESLSADNRAELQGLLHQLMVGEIARYLIFCLDQHRLPVPASHHLERLQTYLEKGAEITSLGILLRIAWSAARDANSAATTRPMRKEYAAAHSVNQVVRYIERVIKDPEELDTPHREDTRAPLSEATRIIFLILGVSPMTAMPVEIADVLDGAPDGELRRNCDDRIPDRVELLARLETDKTWSPQQFREALELISEDDYKLCVAGCAHDIGPRVATRTLQFYDRFAFEGNEKAVALLAAEATDIGNRTSQRGRYGDFVLAEVVRHLEMMSADEEAGL